MNSPSKVLLKCRGVWQIFEVNALASPDTTPIYLDYNATTVVQERRVCLLATAPPRKVVRRIKLEQPETGGIIKHPWQKHAFRQDQQYQAANRQDGNNSVAPVATQPFSGNRIHLQHFLSQK